MKSAAIVFCSCNGMGLAAQCLGPSPRLGRMLGGLSGFYIFTVLFKKEK